VRFPLGRVNLAADAAARRGGVARVVRAAAPLRRPAREASASAGAAGKCRANCAESEASPFLMMNCRKASAAGESTLASVWTQFQVILAR